MQLNNEYIFANWWKRLIAFLIDNLISSIAGSFISQIIFRSDEIMDYYFYILFYFSYNIFMDYKFQGTFGKRVFKLKVIKIDGQPLNLFNSAYRNLAKLISAIPPFNGFLRILIPGYKQTIHDYLAKCYVIEGTIPSPAN